MNRSRLDHLEVPDTAQNCSTVSRIRDKNPESEAKVAPNASKPWKTMAGTPRRSPIPNSPAFQVG